MPNMPDVCDLIAFESGDMTQDEVKRLIKAGIKDGWVWELQGTYGRLAHRMIEDGVFEDDFDPVDRALEHEQNMEDMDS